MKTFFLKLLISLLTPFHALYQRSLLAMPSEKKDAILHLKVHNESEKEETLFDQKKIYTKNILRFLELDIKDIMTNRQDILAIDINTHFEDVCRIASEYGFSRIPIYDGEIDNLLGVLHVKKLLLHIHEDNSFAWRNLISPAFFVPEYKDVHKLLKDFQKSKIHIALVIDEYGSVVGVISLEDILEEIVGEIIDEFDPEELPLYSKIEEGVYSFEAKISLNDFCKAIGLDNDELFDDVKGEADSLGGLVLALKGEMPAPSETLEFNKYLFTVESVDSRQIKRIKVSIKC